LSVLKNSSRRFWRRSKDEWLFFQLPLKEISFLPVRKITDFCLRRLAALIKTVGINRVWIEENKVYKRRCWWGWPLILIGNPVLACRQVPVRVLFTKQWVRWEREIT